MTEPTQSFGVPAEPVPFQDETEGQDRRKRLLLGGALGAVVIAAGGFFLLGGDDAEEDFSVPVRTPHAAPSAESAPAAIPAASTQIGRNPFSARYIEPAEAPAAPTDTASAGTVSTVGTAPATSGGTIALPGTVTSPVTAPVVGTTTYPLTLVSISKPQPEARTFVFKYDDKEVTVLPAQRFGKHGELVVLAYTMDEAGEATGAVLQVGDAPPIPVSVGETVNVL